MKKILFAVVILHGYVLLQSQQPGAVVGDKWLTENRGLKVGDTLPDIEFGKIVNNRTGKTKFSQLKGKLIILDFWNTYCTSCIAFFPKMEEIQQQFGDRIQIFLVNSRQTQEQIEEQMQRSNYKLKFPDLPSIANAKVLSGLFPTREVPYHVWIDGEGIVRMMGPAQNTYSAKIEQILRGDKIGFIQSGNTTPRFNPDTPYFNIAAKPFTPGKYNAILTPFNNDYSVLGGQSRMSKDLADGTVRNTYVNTELLEIVRECFPEIKRYARSVILNNYVDNVIFSVSDTGRYTNQHISQKAGNFRLTDTDIIKSHYCYEQIAPAGYSAEQLADSMLSDLNNHVGTIYGAHIRKEKRKIPCYSLVRTSKIDKLTSKSGAYSSSDITVNGKLFSSVVGADFKNIMRSTLMNSELYCNNFDGQPFYLIDETGYENTPVDIVLPAFRIKGIDELRGYLKKYRLDIISTERDIDFIVIEEADRQPLFNVTIDKDRYLFNIPDTLLGRDFLVTSRVMSSGEKNASEIPLPGDLIGKTIIKFSSGQSGKIFVKLLNANYYSKDSSRNGMFHSVATVNHDPIVAVLPVVKNNVHGHVVDLTSFINNANGLLFVNQPLPLNSGGYDPEKSFVTTLKSFRNNIEIRSIKTYSQGLQVTTYELATSIVLLNALPMQVRYADERIGYATNTGAVKNFDTDLYEAKHQPVINRWRMEPKPGEAELYKQGKLVEPRNPIVFTIDPTTPAKWVPYLVKGVNAWHKAFEKAGFKNAICAKVVSRNDPSWDPGSVLCNAIVWKPTIKDNASGNIITDFRTGEILSATVHWYHNEIKWNRDNYFILASPTDKRARTLNFDDELMGEIIASVITHEVGHTLGLDHNFTSSSKVSVNQLRNKKWVEENGFCPSIMEYARYNFIAQPEDSIGLPGLMRRIGVYDKWAIEWGYKWLPELNSYAVERQYMNTWINSRVEKDDRLVFGSGEGPMNYTEDLGDDITKSNYYALRNLRMVMDSLVAWTAGVEKQDIVLAEMHQKIISMYKTYLKTVMYNIYGKYSDPYAVYNGLPKTCWADRKQAAGAIQFLNEQLFTTPSWLFNSSVMMYTGKNPGEILMLIHKEFIEDMLGFSRLRDLVEFEYSKQEKAYSLKQYLGDITTGIFSELSSGKTISIFRRNLQKLLVMKLGALSLSGKELIASDNYLVTASDILPAVRTSILGLRKLITHSAALYKDEKNASHLKQLSDILKSSIE